MNRSENAMIPGFDLIKQGAEARLFKGNYLGRETVMKERFVKKYRHPDLDTLLTKERTKGEARAIVRAKAAGVSTPALYLVDFDRRRIYMEYVNDAVTVKDFIDSKVTDRDNVGHLVEFLGRRIGSVIGLLHSNGIIHGDLTTSNVLLKNFTEETRDGEKHCRGDLVMIDFGLARIDTTPEDKAVDLYVLERALLSAHSQTIGLFDQIFTSYRNCCGTKDRNEVISKYKEVQSRGRKRLMIG